MKFLLFVAIIAAAVVLAAWLLPWWATLALVAVVLAPVVWIAWKIIRAIKKDVVPALKKVAAGMPRSQERLCSLPAGEPFRGNGFAFTLPVPCEVSQTVIDDLEALILKPAAGGPEGSGAGLIVVSTIPRDELKVKINDQLEAVFTQVQAGLAERGRPGEELQTEAFQPLEVGPLRGEFRQFKAANAEKRIRGETVFLGGEAFSVAWALAGPEDKFDDAAKRYRELAGLIKRVGEAPVIDVPAANSTAGAADPRRA